MRLDRSVVDTLHHNALETVVVVVITCLAVDMGTGDIKWAAQTTIDDQSVMKIASARIAAEALRR